MANRKKKPENIRSKQVIVKVTQLEHDKLLEIANEKTDGNVSELLRKSALNSDKGHL